MPDQTTMFSKEAQNTLYEIIFNRRDVRGEFKPDPISDDIIARLLIAAHHAPSVGFMQPWNFLLIQNKATKKAVHKLFDNANQ